MPLTDEELLLWVIKVQKCKEDGLKHAEALIELEISNTAFAYRMKRLDMRWRNLKNPNSKNNKLTKNLVFLPNNIPNIKQPDEIKNESTKKSKKEIQVDSTGPYTKINEETLKNYVLELANDGEPDVRVAQMMFTLLREKKEIVQDKDASLEMPKDKIRELMEAD